MSEHDHPAHVTSPKTYHIIFAALLVLTVLTVFLAQFEMGMVAHMAVGFTIATTKAVLVALFFMHLLHGSRMTWMTAVAALFWLLMLLVGIMNDYLTRDILRY